MVELRTVTSKKTNTQNRWRTAKLNIEWQLYMGKFDFNYKKNELLNLITKKMELKYKIYIIYI